MRCRTAMLECLEFASNNLSATPLNSFKLHSNEFYTHAFSSSDTNTKRQRSSDKPTSALREDMFYVPAPKADEQGQQRQTIHCRSSSRPHIYNDLPLPYTTTKTRRFSSSKPRCLTPVSTTSTEPSSSISHIPPCNQKSGRQHPGIIAMRTSSFGIHVLGLNRRPSPPWVVHESISAISLEVNQKENGCGRR